MDDSGQAVIALQEEDPLAAAVAAALLARGERVAVVETTAGGLLSARLLSVPGASVWFDRGVVAYSMAAKSDLGTDMEVLRAHGAVSLEAVVAMAVALRARSGAAWVVAESGIAGPVGSRRSPKPVGSVAIAVGGPDGTEATEVLLLGGRVAVMTAIAERALQLLLEAIERSAREGADTGGQQQ
ncbi:MAG: CinA family protein [Dehalococcoidia bacterium]|nr:CinA family protein [Dehalococcoidia bacterium]